MHFFPKLNNRNRGRRLTVTSVVLLALASASPVLHAQDWDHINGRDKVHDPTGAWLVRTTLLTGPQGKPGAFFLIGFHKGGTLTENIQGENAFDPSAVTDPTSLLNIITSPQHGVWQKTGWNTFAATLLAMQFHVRTNPPDAPLFRFDKVQYSGRLSETGDQMEISAFLTFFDVDGNQLNPDGTPGTDGIPFKANATRIPLEVSPNSVHSLPIPFIPTAPPP